MLDHSRAASFGFDSKSPELNRSRYLLQGRWEEKQESCMNIFPLDIKDIQDDGKTQSGVDLTVL